MVSVAKLLNPEPPRAPLPASRPSSVSSAQHAGGYRSEQTSISNHSIGALRMLESASANAAARPKAKVTVNFPPFEELDEASVREVQRFQVHPLGSIQETSERIPYNSGKKDFFSKTGREGFEVFSYSFKVPGNDTNYTVMWDYNVGLVRMTSFFKCRGYSKTTPAKMLNMNAGLKDITYSITGGSIKAQGYWMPYTCARAICATFCHKIAGALIPLFGPRFPFECIPENALGHGHMVISKEIVERAKCDATMQFRPAPALPSPRLSRSASPLISQRSTRTRDPYDYPLDHHQGRRYFPGSYTDHDAEYRSVSSDHYNNRRPFPPIPPLRIPTSRPLPGPPSSVPTPQQSPGWTPVNRPPAPQFHPPHPHRHRTTLSQQGAGGGDYHGGGSMTSPSPAANPWLSVIPRSPPTVGGRGRGGEDNTHRWGPYHPRSHYRHRSDDQYYCYYYSSPPLTHSGLFSNDQGVRLAPLRLGNIQSNISPNNSSSSISQFGGNHHHPSSTNSNNNKRRFSKVDTTTTTSSTGQPSTHPNNPSKSPEDTDLNDDEEEEEEEAYDASDSRAGSDSPESVAAPPPTPNSPSSRHSPSSFSTAATLRHPVVANTSLGGPTSSTTSDADVDGGGSSGNGNGGRGSKSVPIQHKTLAASLASIARRASERDAAMMLMHMHMRGHDDTGDDGDDDGDDDSDEEDEEEGEVAGEGEMVGEGRVGRGGRKASGGWDSDKERGKGEVVVVVFARGRGWEGY
ncbi:hypothetical protein B0J18DRAFT_406205 [Chaetomium sp. MPI-SDFR-AT-0129]|nr:hypothetical protein B0J18DRAFT_406205 [Chaetomium sp. MPI-SDFR-AT-0129]